MVRWFFSICFYKLFNTNFIIWKRDTVYSLYICGLIRTFVTEREEFRNRIMSGNTSDIVIFIYSLIPQIIFFFLHNGDIVTI